MTHEQTTVHVLGRFSVRRGGDEVPPSAFAGRLARRLVRILITRRGSLVPRDVLVGALWSARLPSDPDANLNVLVNRARRALGDASLIETLSGGYAFAGGDRCVVDGEVVLAAIGRGRELLAAGDSAAALRCLVRALEDWGDPLPEDTYEDWARGYRDTLLRARQDALEAAVEASLDVGDAARAASLAEEAVRSEPLREPGHLLLVRAHAAAGDQASALRAFETMRRRLDDELGLEPSAEAWGLQRRVLDGEGLGAVAPTAAPRVSVNAGELPFAGREQLLELLLDRMAAPTPASAIVVAGRSGTGKSRLLRELAARSPQVVLVASAYRPERTEPWSLMRSLLREVLALDGRAAGAVPDHAAAALRDLVPELGDYRHIDDAPLDAESRRALAAEAAIALLSAAASDGLLVAADDVQWADASSLALLGRAAARVRRLLPVLTYRPEEVRDDHRLHDLLGDLRRTGEVIAVELGALDAAGVDDMAYGDLAALLLDETDATPMALAQSVRTLAGDGTAVRGPDGRWHLAPEADTVHARSVARAGQRRTILDHVDQQAPRRREVLSVLALLARETTARTIGRALGVTQREVLDELDALARAGLAHVGDHGWAVAHDMVAEALVGSLARPARAGLHQRLADALRAEDGDAAEIGRHLAAAGDRDAAAEALAEAAWQRLDRFANGEAVDLATQGLGLGRAPSVRSMLLEVRAEAEARAGHLHGARADLRGAIAERPHGPDRAPLLARLAMLESGAEDMAAAAEVVEMALAEAGERDVARARALATGAIVDMNTGHPDRAAARADEAMQIFEAAGDARGIGDVLDGRAMAQFLGGDVTGGVQAFDRVARLFADAGDLMRVVTPRSTRGHGFVFLARPAEGLAEAQAALDLARSLGYREGVSYSAWHASEALTALGRVDEALAVAEEALTVAERLGHRGWTATALRAIGLAHRAGGDLDGAEKAFRHSLDTSTNLSLFSCWASAQLAIVLLERGELAEAGSHVQQALSEGPPLARYEARLAHAELAAAAGRHDARTIVDDAIRQARSGGHLASLPRLTVLERRLTGRSSSV